MHKHKREFIILIALTISCVLSIIAYGTYRCRNAWFKDPLTQSPVGDLHFLHPFLDGWACLHFWFFAFLTYLCPHLWGLIIFIGIIWELIEMLFKERPFYLLECNIELSDKKDGWWYGRWQDLISNSLGMILGYYLYKIQSGSITFFIGMLIAILSTYFGFAVIQARTAI